MYSPLRTLVLIFLAIVLCPLESQAEQPSYLYSKHNYATRHTQQNGVISQGLSQNGHIPGVAFVQPLPGGDSNDPSVHPGHLPIGIAQYPAFTHQQEQKQPSALEGMYSKRIVDELEQFGYDLFGVPSSQTAYALDNFAQNTRPMGAVQDDFTLSSGDEIEVLFTGQKNEREIYVINERGQLLLPDMPPIPAAGRSIGQVRVSIQAAANNLHNTEAYVSLATVRQIGVLVIGHVKRPGRQTMTVFHTALDALMAAGGIDKTGSLRQIKIVREGRSGKIDLYSLLLHGASSPDLRLQDGDRIIVPAIGPTVAVAGEVKRPGIYEILPRVNGMRHQPEETSEKLSLNEMLELGGGVLAPGKNRFLKIAIDPLGAENLEDVHEPFQPAFGDGAVLIVSKGTEKRAGSVELQGHTRRPGMYALSENTTLSALLSSEDILGPDIYPLIGVIERWNTQQLTHELISFPLRLALKGDYDRTLEDGDVVELFSNEQIENLAYEKAGVRDTKNNEYGRAEEDFFTPAAFGSRGPENKEALKEHGDVIEDTVLSSFLRERAAFIRGAVRKPGAYPVGEGTSLDSIVSAAGGLSLEANVNNIEITSKGLHGITRNTIDTDIERPADVMIGPGDAVRVMQRFQKIKDNSVQIMGEVRNPGRYDLLPGDKISDLIVRAGGYTEQAYPKGAIHSRKSERKAEKMRNQAQARDIRRSVASAIETDEGKVDAARIAEARALAEELENIETVGRITVEADLATLKLQPELDALLEPGDYLFVPKRSLNVRVSGQVLSPAMLQFREGKDPLKYINEAGGFTFHADKDRTFVLYPDGSAQPLKVSAWNHRATFIPPGSTIVVPRDPEPFDFIESAKDISQILSNLAITAIFIDDVRDD